MKNRAQLPLIALASTFLILFPIFTSSAVPATAAQNTKLFVNETLIEDAGSASYPDIYRDWVVWQENCSGNSDIYLYNLSTSQKAKITASGKAYRPKIYGDTIVWLDGRNGYYDKR